jgi:hypothetical protein
MTDGDLLPTSGNKYAAEIRDTLMGQPGSVWHVNKLVGPGTVKVRRSSGDNGLGHGSSNGLDFLDDIPYIIDMYCKTGDAASAELAVDALAEAWAPAEGLEDLRLDVYTPGRGHTAVLGRSEGIDPIREFPQGGLIRVQATFIATNPIPIEDP